MFGFFSLALLKNGYLKCEERSIPPIFFIEDYGAQYYGIFNILLIIFRSSVVVPMWMSYF